MIFMRKLENKISIVTGGASGIGEATVRQFVKEGSKVVIADIDKEKGEKLKKELTSSGADVLFVKTNVTDESQVENLISKTVEKHGRLDVLFNNAGIVNHALIHEMEFDEWRKAMSLNIDGAFLIAKHSVKQMLKNGGGNIVNTSSMNGHVAITEQAPYNASKHAVIGLTQSLSIEYALENIRANAVCPGYVDTPHLDFLSQEEKDKIGALHPIGRLAQPEEIAKAVVFLASEDSSFVTGTSLLVDGGYTAQ